VDITEQNITTLTSVSVYTPHDTAVISLPCSSTCSSTTILKETTQMTM